MTGLKASIVTLGWLSLAGASAWGQGVAFEPIVSSFPNGVTMSTTPVVSADRRYVRMTLAPQFTVLQGFDNYSVPAAVGGGGAGGGGLGGGAGFAGLNGPMAGPPGLGGYGQASADQAGGFGSGDFEDRGWTGASAPAPVRSQAAAVPRASTRKGKRSMRSQQSAALPSSKAKAKTKKMR